MNKQGKDGTYFFEESDQLKGLVTAVIREIPDTEFLEYIGVQPYERQSGRRDYRNGYKPRRIKTRIGEIELAIPQARYESFRTPLFRRYQRSERTFLLALQEIIIQGVSTRKVRKVAEQLCGVPFSKSTVSKLTTELDSEINSWLQRPLSGNYPYLIVDAICEKVRENHRVAS